MRGGASTKERFNRVEREMIRCAPLGIPADVSAMGVAGAKPVVSAEFLSRLWMGLIPGVRAHPYGLGLKGARVEGDFSVLGARGDQAGRTSLVGLFIWDCMFAAPINLARARIDTLHFEQCTFEDAANAILAISCEILGQIYMEGCTANGDLMFNNAVIGDDLSIVRTTCRHLALSFAEIAGGFLLNEVTAGNGATAVFGRDMVVSSGAKIVRSTLKGLFWVENASFGFFAMERSTIQVETGSVALHISGVRSEGGIGLLLVRANRQIFAQRVSASSIMMLRCLVVPPDDRYAVNIIGTQARSFFRIQRCLFRGGVSADHVRTDGRIEVFRNIVYAVDPNQTPQLDLAGARAVQIMVDGCRVQGRLSVSFASAEYNMMLTNSMIAGGVDLQEFRCGALSIASCGVGRLPDGWSFRGFSLRATGIVSLVSCWFTGALAVVTGRANEVQIAGCYFGKVVEGTVPDLAFWIGETQIERRFTFDLYRPRNGPVQRSCIDGTMSAPNLKVGQSVALRSLDIRPGVSSFPEGSQFAVDLTGAEIGNSITLAPYRDTDAGVDAWREQPAAIDGAVVLDQAKVRDSVHVQGGTRIATQATAPLPPAGSEREDRVRQRKHGVALSAVGARIDGALEIGAARLDGIVDLRDADIRLIADGCGSRWEAAGLVPGQLLLDGLSYRDLDDGDAPNTARGQNNEVSRRLAWLALQYPDRTATPATFVPQPYDQLAAYFASNGNERARRRAHVARRDLQRRHAGLGAVERSVEQILSWTGGYGYSPGRAAAIMAGVIVIGAVLAGLAYLAGGVVPADPKNVPVHGFNALLYAIDLAIPFLDLGAADGWAIAPDKLGGGWGWDLAVPVTTAIYRVIGLVVVSITVLTFSGILREKE